MHDTQVTTGRTGEGALISLSGPLTLDVLARARSALRGAVAKVDQPSVTIDLAKVERLDTGGAHLIVQALATLQGAGRKAALGEAKDSHRALIEQIAASQPEERMAEPPPPSVRSRLDALGRWTLSGVQEIGDVLGFLGLTLTRLAGSLIRPGRVRFTSLVHNMQEVGLNAVPIVVLMSFLIGIVLAYMGSVQLRAFGAEVFVVNLVAIAVLRELAVLLTAIIVAGRSGSAFTAAIGSMKVREEIDAMQTLGLDPIETLVLPRVVALLLMLPVLTLIADFAGLLGGGLMSWLTLDISPASFIIRLQDTTDLWHYGVGLIKAPVFALIIGIIGCYQGFQVSGSADSVGRLTTTSVVRAIFLVILADAAFAIFFVEVGI